MEDFVFRAQGCHNMSYCDVHAHVLVGCIHRHMSHITTRSPHILFCFFILEAINHAAEAWGIRCMRYEIKDIQLPTKVREAMQMQVS